jgi:hypothetical protein
VKSALLVLSCAAISRAAASSEPDLGRVTRIALPESITAREVSLDDVDGDGRRDLVIVARDPSATRARMLRIHRRRAEEPAFAAAPDEIVGFTPEVIAWAFADVREHAGRELVLFTASAVYVWSLGRGEGAEEVERVLAVDLLWQIPRTLDPLRWQAGVRDLDGDGLDDLIVPQDGGYRVAFQDRVEGRGRFERTQDLPAPVLRDRERSGIDFPDEDDAAGASAKSRGGRLELSLGAGSRSDRSTLVARRVAIPPAWSCDWDGDDDLDLVLLSPEHLSVYLQASAREFSSAPDLVLDSPVVRDRRRAFDPSFAAHAADLDGDRKSDCVFLARDRDAKEVRTQILVYTQASGALFGNDGVPQELLVLAGFTGDARMPDVDGDGRLDLVVTSFRPDTLDAVRSAAGGALDLELVVFLRTPPGFARRPSLSATIAMPLEDEPIAPVFLGDVDGDGLSDLLVNDAASRLRVRLLRRRGDRLELAPGAAADVAIPDAAEAVTAPRTESMPAEVVAVSEHEVVHVEF